MSLLGSTWDYNDYCVDCNNKDAEILKLRTVLKELADVVSDTNGRPDDHFCDTHAALTKAYTILGK